MKIIALVSILTGFLLGLSFGTDFPFLEGMLANWFGSLLIGVTSGMLSAAWWTHAIETRNKFSELKKDLLLEMCTPATLAGTYIALSADDKRQLPISIDHVCFRFKGSAYAMGCLGLQAEKKQLLQIEASLKEVRDGVDISKVKEVVDGANTALLALDPPLFHILTKVAWRDLLIKLGLRGY